MQFQFHRKQSSVFHETSSKMHTDGDVPLTQNSNENLTLHK